MTWMTRVLLDVSLNPDPTKLPGSGTLSDLVNGLAAWSLIFAVAAFVMGAGAWAIGAATSNVGWADRGKSATIVAALAALLIGAAAIIINFFFHLGGGLH
jgi:hypothetical protein